MHLDQVFVLVERLRKEAIGEPKWIEEKRVYEYPRAIREGCRDFKDNKGCAGFARACPAVRLRSFH